MTNNPERCRLRLDPPLECEGACITHAKQAFISHAKRDEAIARRIAKSCCDGGVAPYLFEFTPESFAPSIDNAEVIANEVHKSDIVLLLLGPHISRFWTQAWIGFEIGVSLGADVATNRTVYNGYFSKKVFVLQDIRQGIDASVPRLDALLLFNFSSTESWGTFQRAIGVLTDKYLNSNEVKPWSYERLDSSTQTASDEINFLDDFSQLNAFRQSIMTGRAICGNPTCNSNYDVWLMTDDTGLLNNEVAWVNDYQATCSIECPSCDNREVTLTIQRSQ